MFIRDRPFVFFQAEDGIRDRSPSRGLGDVYKRQIRAISDKADGSAEMDYTAFEHEAAKHSARLVEDLVQKIQ